MVFTLLTQTKIVYGAPKLLIPILQPEIGVKSNAGRDDISRAHCTKRLLIIK